MNTLPVVQSQEATTFNFGGVDIPCIFLAGEYWFIAKFACEVLGYTNVSRAVSTHVLIPENKRTILLRDLENLNMSIPDLYRDILTSLKYAPSVVLINKSGLIELACSSKRPLFVAFRKWVFNEIIPAVLDGKTVSLQHGIQEQQVLQLQQETLAPLVAQLEQLEEAQLEANAKGVTAGRPTLDGLVRPQYALDTAKQQIMIEHIFDEDMLRGALSKNSEIYDIIIADVRTRMPDRLKGVPSTDLLDRSYCYRLINERRRMLRLQVAPWTKPAQTGNKYLLPSGLYIH